MQTHAFIDSQNLYKSVNAAGYSIDYRRFRLWLKNRHHVDRAIMFFGYMDENREFYQYLEKCGFELVFRDVDYHLGKRKSNVDICLTINVLDTIEQFDKAILVSSDGDFYDLVERLKRDAKFGGVISPQSQKRCSTLLKKSSKGQIAFIPDVIHKIARIVK